MRIVPLIIYGLILFVQFENTAAIVFKFTNAVCQSENASAIIINFCRIKAINRYRRTFNFNATLVEPVRLCKVYISTFKRASGYKPWLYQFSLNICKYLNKPYNPLAMLIFNPLKQFINFHNDTCPMQGVKTIIGYYLRPDMYNLPLPSGEYLIAFSWHFNGRLAAYTNISAILEEN